MKQVRCAIYTRKSSDEGLDQAFNSLDAQREACAAYILSQASEGWTALPDIYDDGGLSGGTLDRPALKRLLAEVAAGRVDTIVVYKVDRLTRSLFDFAKLVETFDQAGTSFVSVTQSFNTTTSMGRLTLNMLLSFAQFEREVTAERIRDKIAASKAKGMWMGGTPPLGYRPEGRSLAVVQSEATLIEHLLDRYLALGNVRLLAEELERSAIRLPVRNRLNGNGTIGGGWFTRGQIYKILSNPIYIGRIPHGDKRYAGLHWAIIDSDRWDRVQALLADNLQGSKTRVRCKSPSLLAGRIVDQAGEPLIATHAGSGTADGGKRYRYYISRALNEGRGAGGIRIAALAIEAAVCDRIAAAFDDPLALAGAIGATLDPVTIRSLVNDAGAIAAQCRRRHRATVLPLVAAVRVLPELIEIDCCRSAMANVLGVTHRDEAPASVTLTADLTLRRSGRVLRLVDANGAPMSDEPNAALLRLVLKARRWWKLLQTGEVDLAGLATREGVQPSYVTRVLRLAFLSPAVVEAIVKGRLGAGVDVKALTLAGPIPASWREQAALFLPGANK